MRESKPLPDGRGTVFSTVRANINLRINNLDCTTDWRISSRVNRGTKTEIRTLDPGFPTNATPYSATLRS